MTSDEMFAKHGLVLVLAKDVRKMMDYYQVADPELKTPQNDEQYYRLWDALHAVGLDFSPPTMYIND